MKYYYWISNVLSNFILSQNVKFKSQTVTVSDNTYDWYYVFKIKQVLLGKYLHFLEIHSPIVINDFYDEIIYEYVDIFQ